MSDAAPSIKLLLSVAADLLDQSHEMREYGDWGAVSIEAQARQVVGAALDLLAGSIDDICLYCDQPLQGSQAE
jgi:hypothetical protein